MTMDISYKYPAKTFQREMLALACLFLGGLGLWTSFSNGWPIDLQDWAIRAIISLVLFVFGAGAFWGMARPQKITLTDTHMVVPRTLTSGQAREIPYDDIIGVSIVIREWGQTGVIMSVGHKLGINTHTLGKHAFYDLIEQIHARAPHLGKPAIGTLGGVFRAGRMSLPK